MYFFIPRGNAERGHRNAGVRVCVCVRPSVRTKPRKRSYAYKPQRILIKFIMYVTITKTLDEFEIQRQRIISLGAIAILWSKPHGGGHVATRNNLVSFVCCLSLFFVFPCLSPVFWIFGLDLWFGLLVSVTHFFPYRLLQHIRVLYFQDSAMSQIADKRLRTVYRLLREDEDREKGIVAKDPESTTSVVHHVLQFEKGKEESYQQSKYISTCKNLQAIIEVSSFKMPSRCYPVVQIDLDSIPPGYIQIIDLCDPLVRESYAKKITDDSYKEKFENFVKEFQEILLIGHVPNTCIHIVSVNRMENLLSILSTSLMSLHF